MLIKKVLNTSIKCSNEHKVKNSVNSQWILYHKNGLTVTEESKYSKWKEKDGVLNYANKIYIVIAVIHVGLSAIKS